jgi:hypothetical protein
MNKKQQNDFDIVVDFLSKPKNLKKFDLHTQCFALAAGSRVLSVFERVEKNEDIPKWERAKCIEDIEFIAGLAKEGK